MKRKLFVLIDETKNEFISAIICNSVTDLTIQLDNALQKESFDVKVSAYYVDDISLDDDNNFYVNSCDKSKPVWNSIKTEISHSVKSDVQEDGE